MRSAITKLANLCELEAACAQPVQEHAPSKLTRARMGSDRGPLKRKTGPARHSHGDAFFHLDCVVHQLGSRAVQESSTSESDVNPRLPLWLGLTRLHPQQS